VPTGQPANAPGKRDVLIVPINATLTPGAFTVTWHAVALDTHKTQGTFIFTVAP
jgi:methionine-rich copper-binding protein CopC